MTHIQTKPKYMQSSWFWKIWLTEIFHYPNTEYKNIEYNLIWKKWAKSESKYKNEQMTIWKALFQQIKSTGHVYVRLPGNLLQQGRFNAARKI